MITIFIPPLVTEPDEVATAIAEGARGVTGKPVVGVFMRAGGAPAALAPIPSYAFPESAALALARVTKYGQWLAKPLESPPVLANFAHHEIRRIVEGVLRRGGGWATPDEAKALLSAAGIDSAASRVATTRDAAVRAASTIGYPLALKALGPTLLHKTERRAVHLRVLHEAALRLAYADFERRFGNEMTAVLVQRMVPTGVEVVVGAVQDPLFGPLIACGTGGVLVDVLADTSFRLHPLSPSDAGEMIHELRGLKLLRGYRARRRPTQRRCSRCCCESQRWSRPRRNSGARPESRRGVADRRVRRRRASTPARRNAAASEPADSVLSAADGRYDVPMGRRTTTVVPPVGGQSTTI